MNTEVAQKSLYHGVNYCKTTFNWTLKGNEKQVDYKLTWSVHWTNQKLLYCSVIVLVVLQIIQHEELMASEWGYKKQK